MTLIGFVASLLVNCGCFQASRKPKEKEKE
jgi:hypothetical protein